MTANTHGTQKLDQNGEKAALIKIQAPIAGLRSTVVRWVSLRVRSTTVRYGSTCPVVPSD